MNLVDNASSSRQVKNAERVERERAKTNAADLAWLLSEAAGRRFLYRLITELCDLEGASHVGGLVEMDMHHHEGRRFVGIQLLNRIRETNPLAWVETQREAVTMTQREINPGGERDA